MDLHGPSGAAQLNAAAAPSGCLFESPSQTRLCIVAPLTELSQDTRTLDLAAKRLYGPLDTVAFFDPDFTHTAQLCGSNRRLLNQKKDRPKGQVLSFSPASTLRVALDAAEFYSDKAWLSNDIAQLHGPPPAPPVRLISYRPQPRAPQP